MDHNFKQSAEITTNQRMGDCCCACHGNASGELSPIFTGDSIEFFDAKLEELTCTTRALKRRRNALLPVARLPPEILCQIFRLLIPSKSRTEAQIQSRWFAFSHVHHLWRAVALSSLGLWTFPCFRSPKMAQLMLDRSHPLPIQIWYDYSPNSAVLSAMAQTDRVRSVDLTMQAAVFRKMSSALLARPFPALEVLDLKLDRVRRDDDDDPEPFLPSIFDGSAPRLRTLRLSGFVLSWNSPLVRQLSHLNVDGIVPGRRLATWVEVLDALQEMTNLAVLSLSYALPSIDHMDVPSRSLDLPRLRYISIKDKQTPVSVILRTLVSSPSLEVVLSFDDFGTPSTGANMAILCPVLNGFLRSCDKHSRLRSLDLKESYWNSRVIVSLRTGTSSDIDKRAPNLFVLWPIDVHQLDRLFGMTETAQWTRNVTTLTVDGEGRNIFSRMGWGVLFLALRNVRHVKIRGFNALVAFLKSLSQNARAAAQSVELALPLLSALGFESRHGWYWPAFPKDNLEYAFRRRAELGVPLRRLGASSEFLEPFNMPLYGIEDVIYDAETSEDMFGSGWDDDAE